jgi:hypothetical protein
MRYTLQWHFLCSNSLFLIMSLSIASAAAPVNKVFFHAFYNKVVHLGRDVSEPRQNDHTYFLMK